MNADNIAEMIELAMRHHRLGQFPQADKLYRQVLAQQPNHPDALHLLGVLAAQLGKPEVAIGLIGQAIAIRPDMAAAHNHLGNALRNSGQLDRAVAAYRESLRLAPDSAQTHTNLGNALGDQGKLDEAVAAYRQAIRIDPNNAAAYNNLASALRGQDLLDEAIAYFQHAVRLMPGSAEIHHNLGLALYEKRSLDDAIAAYRQALAIKADYATAHMSLGLALRDLRQFEESIAAFRRAIQFQPNYPEACTQLAIMLRKQRHLDPAIAAFREALRLKPDSAIPWLNLASAVTEVGQLDEALACLDRAIALEPADPTFHSARLFTLMFHPAFDAGAILDAARAFDRRYGEPCKPLIVPHENDPSPGRRLRIGYVSPDFKGHCQLLFMMPLLAAHDREAVEVFCYSNVVEPDNLTDQYRAHADTWRNIRGISDADAAEMIRQDRIDILVDLTMHMKDNRLPLFARKPAPLQVSWLAYPGTTGLSAIDYRLTDPYLDPPGLNDADYSERSIHLPDCFWCFDPMQSDLPVGPLPALSAGHVTFGCLNNFCKVNEPVLITWAQVLQNVAESRLLLLAPDGGTRERVIEILQRQGVARERVEFVPFQSRGRYLREYCRIDIGLDTFPYNGHTTSLDSFWMGVPVVTLVGRTVVGRAGWCQLSNLGLVELATNNSDQFVQTAGALARDLQRLGEYRSSLRERMERSPLMNIPRFARNIESAFRTMWRHWCAGQR